MTIVNQIMRFWNVYFNIVILFASFWVVLAFFIMCCLILLIMNFKKNLLIVVTESSQNVKLGPGVHWDDATLGVSVSGPNLCCCNLYNAFFYLGYLYAFVPHALTEHEELVYILEKYVPILFSKSDLSKGIIYPELVMEKVDYFKFRSAIANCRVLTEMRFIFEYGGFFYKENLPDSEKIIEETVKVATLLKESVKLRKSDSYTFFSFWKVDNLAGCPQYKESVVEILVNWSKSNKRIDQYIRKDWLMLEWDTKRGPEYFVVENDVELNERTETIPIYPPPKKKWW